MAGLAVSQNGWPVHPTSAGCVSLSWITGRVDPRVHDLFNRFCKRFNAEVEPITRAHSWGYANREIRGSATISNHASGTAIDLNAPDHPLGASGTFTAAQVRAIRRLLVDFPQVRWGGDYHGRRDEMHFEINARPEAFMATPRMASPARGRATSPYGPRKPIPGVTSASFHAGQDIANDTGTPIFAAFAGTVRKAGWGIVPYRSGNGILIANPDGEGQYYGHLSRIRVKVGQKVARGERIGDMGATGNVTGPHLHFETWAKATDYRSHYNPLVLFKKYGVRLGSGLLAPPPAKTPPTSTTAPTDWFDMASQADLEKAVWAVLNRDIAVGGATGERHGGKAPLYALIRDGAYSYDVGRAERARLRTELAAVKGALHELAKSKGLDADKVDAAIDKAVKDALSDLKITLTTED